jgi:hypothetical protein
MANAQNVRSTASLPAVHPPKQLRIARAPRTPELPAPILSQQRPSGAYTSRPPPLVADRVRPSAPPAPSFHLEADEGDTISLRLEADEGDTIVRRFEPPRPAASRSLIAPTKEAHDMVRAAVEEALAPIRDRLDEIERDMLETIVRVAKTPPPVPVPAADPTSSADLATQRERRRLLVAMGGLIVINVATLLGVFSSLH